MLKYPLVVCLVLVCLTWAELEPSQAGEGRVGRFLVFLKTTTVTTYLTTSATCVTSTSCATLVNATTACRRRRGFNERPVVLSLDDTEAVNPSQPIALEASVAADLNNPVRREVPELEASSMELDIKGLDELANCGEARNLYSLVSYGVTVLKSTTVTSAVYCSTSMTATTTYTVSGCSPSGVVTCAASG